MPTNPTPTQTHTLLHHLLTEATLPLLAYDHYPAVYRAFTANQAHPERLATLIHHAQTHGGLETLLTHARALDPEQYDQLHANLANLANLPPAPLPPRSPAPLPNFTPPPAADQERRNELTLLHKVWSFWIQGVLEHSLHSEVLLALDMAAQPEAIVAPWDMVLHRAAQPPQNIAPGTPIRDVATMNA